MFMFTLAPTVTDLLHLHQSIFRTLFFVFYYFIVYQNAGGWSESDIKPNHLL